MTTGEALTGGEPSVSAGLGREAGRKIPGSGEAADAGCRGGGGAEADVVVAESYEIMRTATELPGRFGYDRAEHRLHVAEAHLTLECFDCAAAPPETPGWAAATLVLAEARDAPEQAATRALGVLDLIPPARLRATARTRLARLERLLDDSAAPAATELAQRLRALPAPIRTDGTVA
ncbi:hypothetical protein [Streptomyces sp. 4F14]|uniref:hypothetical protein n=1 Tax=Streptomyces sp. 4F14 TaxID=3394380 RepID=UPI003A83BF34